jgi:hypothetical protein
METIKITIEKTADFFTAFSENVEGIYAAGDNPIEVKKSVLEAIRILKENNSSENIPEILKDEFEIVYTWDVPSLLNYYKGILTNSAMERLTGIPQRQIQHYVSGNKSPRPAQIKKIEEGLHKLGEELLEIELV